MTDYTKLVQALRCEELKGIACPDCYERECIANSGKVLYCRVPQLLEDAAAAIEALQAQLPKRGKIVRCGECKHYNAGFECLVEGYGIERDPDWFCGDGKRKVQE